MKNVKSEKKGKTIDLGKIRKGDYGPFLSFDSSIKEITIKREFEIDGETVTQMLKVPVRPSGYLEAANIKKVEEALGFKVENGWMTEDRATREKEYAKENGITSYVTIRVE